MVSERHRSTARSCGSFLKATGDSEATLEGTLFINIYIYIYIHKHLYILRYIYVLRIYIRFHILENDTAPEQAIIMAKSYY